MKIPKDYPVKHLTGKRQKEKADDLITCLECNRSWDDAICTSMTPVPAGRCPFEGYHNYKETK